jgi:dolichol kinase
MLMLALGDPVSGLVGSGELQSVKGARSLLAMFAVSLAVAFGVGLDAVPAVVGAAAATLADGVKPVVATYVVDDNLTIPPAAAVGITLGWLLVGAL